MNWLTYDLINIELRAFWTRNLGLNQCGIWHETFEKYWEISTFIIWHKGRVRDLKRDKNPRSVWRSTTQRPKLFFKILFNNKREQKVSHDDMIAEPPPLLFYIRKSRGFFARAQTAWPTKQKSCYAPYFSQVFTSQSFLILLLHSGQKLPKKSS